MPELPEVETVARGVHERVLGDRVVDVWAGSHSEPFLTPQARLVHGLVEHTFLCVRRAGKHIVCELGEEDGSATVQWIVHLGMTGRLLVTTPDAIVEKHTHLRVTLSSGREVRFVDPRRFGRMQLLDLRKQTGFHEPGQEPMTISAGAFADLFHGRKLTIKAALLNQKLLSGVGNIYADESLFRAGIRPQCIAGKLSKEKLATLRIALQKTLKEAIRMGGSSVSDYVDATGVRGFFQLQHKVYLRTGEPCLVCETPIRRLLIGGRGTHYCPQCQR